MSATLVNPPELAKPKGYSHAAVGTGRVIALAGQIGWDADSKIVSDDLGVQFDKALENLVVALRAAGGKPEDLLSLRMYVVDKHDYNGKLKEIGASYRKHLGRHFPAMALVQVADLLEPGAKVEIEGLAAIE
jgi:enamine deaminase RidA (YjgF/YER057c/UK114 family)